MMDQEVGRWYDKRHRQVAELQRQYSRLNFTVEIVELATYLQRIQSHR